jgi:hypothetical protein
MLETRHCPECGAEIIFDYETPTKSYRITDGEICRDDNNLSDNPELNPYCSNDKTHKIEPEDIKESQEFWSWSNGVYMDFIDRGIYDQ